MGNLEHAGQALVLSPRGLAFVHAGLNSGFPFFWGQATRLAYVCLAGSVVPYLVNRKWLHQGSKAADSSHVRHQLQDIVWLNVATRFEDG